MMYTLETDAGCSPARIGNADAPYGVVAGAQVADGDAEHFQPFFELFNGEIVRVHGGCPFVTILWLLRIFVSALLLSLYMLIVAC